MGFLVPSLLCPLPAPECRAYGVLPAAGRSRRMGQSKLLLPWGSERLIQWVLRQWLAAGLDAVVVVVRPQDDLLARLVHESGALVCHPPEEPQEMKDSVRWGLEYLRQRFRPSDEDAWLLSPCDIPHVTAALIRLVRSYYRPHTREVIVPSFGFGGGHPVALPWLAAAQVEKLGPQQGINHLVRQWPQRVVLLSKPVPQDIDTPEQYHQLAPQGACSAPGELKDLRGPEG